MGTIILVYGDNYIGILGQIYCVEGENMTADTDITFNSIKTICDVR